MSPKRRKDVPQLVEKYIFKYPAVDRDLLRKLIRLENPKLFLDNPSNLKKLDRYLRKHFIVSRQSQSIPQKTTNVIIYEKRLEAIRQANLSDPSLAYVDLLLFIDTLPSTIKNNLQLELQLTTAAIKKSGESRLLEEQNQTQERLKKVTSIAVLYYLNKIPMLLNEEEL